MAGDRFSRFAAVACPEEFCHRVCASLPSADFKQCSHDGPDHIPQEPVCLNGEFPIAFLCAAVYDRCILFPLSFADSAYAGFVVSSNFLETGEIMLPKENYGSSVHLRKVERESAQI